MQKEFNIEDYKLAGHLSPWYEFYSGLDYVDLTFNPYGFNGESRLMKGSSYAHAKCITREKLTEITGF